MTKIKNIIFSKRSKIRHALKDSGFEFSKSDFRPYIVDFVHHFLPLRLKYLSESYALIDENTVSGLITLEKDNGNHKKFKITRLFLEKDSQAKGKLLVDYAISRYGAMGALSFQVVVEDKNTEMINLFVNGCSFRKNANEYLYEISNYKADDFFTLHPEGFKFYKNADAKQTCALYNANINSYQKHNFERIPAQFRPELVSGIKDKISYSYVLEDEKKGRIYGYFNLYTYNNCDFVLDFVLDSGFEIYFEDAINFIAHTLNNRKSNWRLYVKIKSYFSNYKILKNYFEEKNFKLVKTSLILTKDFLKEIKQEGFLDGAKIIFNDITPAYKSVDTKNCL